MKEQSEFPKIFRAILDGKELVFEALGPAEFYLTEGDGERERLPNDFGIELYEAIKLNVATTTFTRNKT